eukprot:3705288-Rhodomonas_salina.1
MSSPGTTQQARRQIRGSPVASQLARILPGSLPGRSRTYPVGHTGTVRALRPTVRPWWHHSTIFQYPAGLWYYCSHSNSMSVPGGGLECLDRADLKPPPCIGYLVSFSTASVHRSEAISGPNLVFSGAAAW